MKDNDFRRWFENLARGSEHTARVRARDLFRFLREQDMTPESIVKLAREDRSKVEDLLMDYVTELHRKKLSPGYMENYLKAVKSWMSFNGIELVRKIKIGNSGATPTLEDERVPTREELRQLLLYADERGRCSICLMAFAGLRPESIGDLNGVDGLEVRDLPEMEIGGSEVTFKAIPTKMLVRPNLSKTRKKYSTFLIDEGCQNIKAYLEKRMALGEDIGLNSPIISVKQGYEEAGFRGKSETRHVTTKTVTKEIRDAMRPKFRWRPYVLRAYFDTQLLLAENHGKISHAYRQFLMGHKGDIEARYTTNKGILPTNVIEDMRQSLLKCEEYLSARPVGREEDPEITTIRTMVESGVLDLSKPNVKQYLIQKLGIQDMEIRVAKTREQGYSDDEAIARVIFGELGIEPMKIETSKPKNSGDPKMVVNEEQLETYLAEGWDVQTVLPSGKILLKRDY